jgi:hypothetical protein
MAFDGPCLRRDLVSTILQEDGVRYVDVYDPKRDSSFRLFDYEYSVALAFDGRPLAKVIPWVRLSTGLELTPEQLMAFAERLGQLGFLASDEAGTPGVAPEGTAALIPDPAADAPQTALPVPEPLATGEPPLPLPEPPATAASEALMPPPTFPEAPSATESRPMMAEPAPPEVDIAPIETPSSDTAVAAEPPAVVNPSLPDSAWQVELRSTADAPPATVETTAAASSPVQEPSPVASETPAVAVPERELPPFPPLAQTPPLLSEPRLSGRAPAAEVSDGASRPQALQDGIRASMPGPRRIVTPPPIPTPPALVTPPSLPSATVHGGPWILYALFGTLAALAVGGLVVPLALNPRPPAATRARVVVARPMDVLRWLDGTAPLEALPSQVLSFPAGGKVIRLASPGTSLRPGDVVAATDAARLLLARLAQQQERLASLEKILQDMRDTGDQKRARAARASVAFGAGLVEQTQQALLRVAVVAQAPNQVEATLATLGKAVRAGTSAARVRRPGWRASFELPRALAVRVRKQGFCAAEIEARPVGCDFAAEGGDETHVVVELAPDSATAAGQPVRLARARLADAFVVPASALSRVGRSDRVLVVAPTGRAEIRNVTVADRTAADAIITQGLDPGDAVVIETSEPVGAGARVRITGAIRE